MDKEDKKYLKYGLDCFIGDIDELEKEVRSRKLDANDFFNNVKPTKKEEIFKVSKFFKELKEANNGEGKLTGN